MRWPRPKVRLTRCSIRCVNLICGNKWCCFIFQELIPELYYLPEMFVNSNNVSHILISYVFFSFLIPPPPHFPMKASILVFSVINANKFYMFLWWPGNLFLLEKKILRLKRGFIMLKVSDRKIAVDPVLCMSVINLFIRIKYMWRKFSAKPVSICEL